MDLLIALAASVAFAFALRRPLKRFPVAFYAAAVAVDVAFVSQAFLSAAPALARALFPYEQRCLFAFGLLAVVMFVGVLPEESRARRELSVVRGELSVVASILVAGHVAFYAESYLARLLAGSAGMPASTAASVATAGALVALLVPLALTSLDAVKRRMPSRAWKRLQRLAYPFFLLIYVHLMLVLLPSAASGASVAFSSICIYTVVMLSYCVLRFAKFLRSRESAGIAGTAPGSIASAENGG